MTYVYVNIDIIYVYDEYKSLFNPEFKFPVKEFLCLSACQWNLPVTVNLKP